MSRKIRMGMVGGGRDAFIGAVHRMAAALDGHIELVCGAFSSDPERSKASGADLYLPADRVYGSYQEMMAAEAKLPLGERMDFVSIVTPNHVHFPVAKAALEAGFHVMSDKPMTFDLAEAKELQAMVQRTGLQFGLTHNYTGYPMVKEARHLVRSGAIGKVRKVVVEYPQGWLAELIEAEGQKQASWRTDPARAGASSCMGDIGTHAENLMEYITGLRITELCADLSTLVEGRQLEDDGNVLCTPARSPPARRIPSLSASTVSRPGWSGIRKSPTPSPSSGGRSIARCGAPASASCRRPAPPTPGCRPAIPRGSWKRSPTCIATTRWHCRRGWPVSSRRRNISIFPRCTTGCAAWPLSRPVSPVPPAPTSGPSWRHKAWHER